MDALSLSLSLNVFVENKWNFKHNFSNGTHPNRPEVCIKPVESKYFTLNHKIIQKEKEAELYQRM